MPAPLYHLNGTEGEPATRWNPKAPLNGITYPPNIGDVWPDADLTAIGLGKAAEADPIPDGKRSTGKTVRTVSGVPKWVHTLEDVPPTYATADEAKAAMVEWANAFNESVTGKVPADEKLSWTHKEQAARAVVAGTADAQQIATIADEAALTGETEADLAALIITKADLYHLVVRKVAGLRRATEVALDAVTDPHDYETVLAGAQAQAAALAAQLGL